MGERRQTIPTPIGDVPVVVRADDAGGFATVAPVVDLSAHELGGSGNPSRSFLRRWRGTIYGSPEPLYPPPLAPQPPKP